jgi:hypothetical protein
VLDADVTTVVEKLITNGSRYHVIKEEVEEERKAEEKDGVQ